jgi:hypothetical protein
VSLANRAPGSPHCVPLSPIDSDFDWEFRRAGRRLPRAVLGQRDSAVPRRGLFRFSCRFVGSRPREETADNPIFGRGGKLVNATPLWRTYPAVPSQCQRRASRVKFRLLYRLRRVTSAMTLVPISRTERSLTGRNFSTALLNSVKVSSETQSAPFGLLWKGSGQTHALSLPAFARRNL